MNAREPAFPWTLRVAGDIGSTLRAGAMARTFSCVTVASSVRPLVRANLYTHVDGGTTSEIDIDALPRK